MHSKYNPRRLWTNPKGKSGMGRHGAYDGDDDIVDFILGITYEIWEERGVDLIHQYYAQDCVVWGLDGITRGAEAVVDGTHKTLGAFPDRLLLAEQVIWSGSREDGYYSSHRLLSTATNAGPTQFGPATGERIRMRNIADCFVENGVITKEWLVRDHMTLARQLGADPMKAARDMAEQQTAEHRTWMSAEAARVMQASPPAATADTASPATNPEAFAWRALRACWSDDRKTFDALYAPYCVLHRSPADYYSGRDQLLSYYQTLNRALGGASVSVDHVAAQPFAGGVDIAVRWTAAGRHEGKLLNVEPGGKPLFILGVTHWRCIAGRIAVEMTVFDDLALLSQTMV